MKVNKIFSAIFTFSLVAAISSFTACNSDNEMEPEPEKPVEAKTYEVDAISTNEKEWVYFSFKQGKVVEVDLDKADEDLSWDIAFQRFYIRTNSGTSGKGKGGAIDTGKKAFDDVSVVPTEGYIVDEVFTMMTTMGQYGDRSANKAFTVQTTKLNYSWAWFEYKQMTWFYNNNVFVIRSADGNSYAKVIMKKYDKTDDGKSGHVVFDYIFPFK